MKTYVKSNNILYSGNTSVIKVYSTLPSDLSDISEDEIIILENVGFYQKVQGTLSPLFGSNSVGGESGDSVGDIFIYYGSTNPDPEHLVICNGSTFSSTDFPELYTLLGTNTTPNLIGYHLKGVGNNSAWTSHDAITLKSKVPANYPNHTHTVSNPGHTHSANNGSHYHCYVGVYSASRAYANTYALSSCTSCPRVWDYCNLFTSLTSCCTCKISVTTVNLGTVTIGCPSTASGYNAVRYGSETKCKDKTVLFLMRAK